MKKQFKTIITAAAILAISTSTISMANAEISLPTCSAPTSGEPAIDAVSVANAEVIPPPTCTQSVFVSGDATTDKFNDINPIQATLTTEHILGATIEFTDMKFKYSVKDNSFGLEEATSNLESIKIINNSTCPITVTIDFDYDTKTYPVLKELGLKDYKSEVFYLSYAGDQNNGFQTGKDFKALPNWPSDIEAIRKYNFNDAKIGKFVITIKPELKIIN